MPCREAINSSVVTAQYAYNPSGLRNTKTVGGSTKYFVYNGMNIVFEYEDSISDGTIYYYGLNRTHNSNGEIYVYNAHGDTVQLVKDNTVVVSYTYDAFGNLTSQTGESDNPFLYCSEYFDEETGTYYLRARYYNPANGRFNAEDPHWNVSNRIYGDNPFKIYEYEDALGLSKYTLLPNVSAIIQSGNLYVYCVNNPILYHDTTGNFAITGTAIGYLLAAAGATIIGMFTAEAIKQAPPITLPKSPNISSQRIPGTVLIISPFLANAANGKSNDNPTPPPSIDDAGGAGDPNDPRNWNRNSTQIMSKELYNDGKIRIDVENPKPTQRPGQVHLQTNNQKNIYDNITKKFYYENTRQLAPRAIQDLLKNQKISNAVKRGVETYLNLVP